MNAPCDMPANEPGTGRMPGSSNDEASRLQDLIRAEIERSGPIPFARFMAMALYTPELGYYERQRPVIGRGGDFFTSVSVGSLFGELLAFYFEARNSFYDRPLRLIEAGAHDGHLAGDILRWLEQWRPDLFQNLEYWIVEPSAHRRQWQRDWLTEIGSREPIFRSSSPSTRARSGRIRWVETLDDLPSEEGCILFCNELLDAMPVHRLGWNSSTRSWFEWGVNRDGDRFGWVRMPAPSALVTLLSQVGPAGLVPAQRGQPATPKKGELADVLPDGYTVELSPTAFAWWHKAAQRLGAGTVMAIDYGLTAQEWICPERVQGTLRAYRGHHHAGDPLADPGEQDLTAHVNFTAIENAGCQAGLHTEVLVTQERFLAGILDQVQACPKGFGAWTADRSRQFQTLTHPAHLGRAFRVLIQSERRDPR
jgi:SAM-dependent MidA family methyltransferase